MTQARPNRHAPDMVRRSLRLPAKLVRQLDQYARTEGISANAATLRILADLLDDNPKADARFTVQVEPNGRMGQYVARFCGEYAGSAPTEREAWALARLFYERRFSGTPETQP